jgi:hypothetical protein
MFSLVCGLAEPERDKRPFMMLQGYFDDSGSDRSPQSPVYVVSGFVSTFMRWGKLSDEWGTALAGPPKIDYFKMREAKSLQGQFRGWQGTDRDAMVLRLGAIIKKYVLYQVYGSLRHSDYDNFVRGKVPPLVDNPYFVCFANILNACGIIAKECPDLSRFDYVFDIQGNLSKVAASSFRELADSTGMGRVLGGVDWRDDKQVLPLQAADYSAWHLRRCMADEKEQSRPSFTMLAGIRTVGSEATKQSLRTIVDGMRGM